MTRVRGSTDYIGPSGGFRVDDGVYHATASGKMELISQNDNIEISGVNILLAPFPADDEEETEGNLFLLPNKALTVGISNFSKPFTPDTIGLYSLASLKNYVNYNSQGAHGLRINHETILNSKQDLNLQSSQNVIFLGDTQFDNTITPTGIHAYSQGPINLRSISDLGVSNYQYGIDIKNDNIAMTTAGGYVPTINGSGIALTDNLIQARFYGAIDGDQAVSTSDTTILWNSSLKNNVIHTNGTGNIFLPNIGIYFINIFLTTDYSIGGRRMTIVLRHYDGGTINVLIERPLPTTHAIRNGIDVAYTVQTDSPNDYIFVRAKVAVAQPGKVWKDTLCGINVVKI